METERGKKGLLIQSKAPTPAEDDDAVDGDDELGLLDLIQL